MSKLQTVGHFIESLEYSLRELKRKAKGSLRKPIGEFGIRAEMRAFTQARRKQSYHIFVQIKPKEVYPEYL